MNNINGPLKVGIGGGIGTGKTSLTEALCKSLSKTVSMAVISNDIYKHKIIFDGYPRNLIQAKNLDNLLKKHKQKIDIVLKLSVSLETVKKRILERQTQEKRADDNEEIAIKRYKTYEKSSEPVIDYYKQSNLLKVVNGEAGISEINSEISGLIDAIKG